MAALSFCYAPPLSGQYTQYVTDDEASILSHLQEACQNISTSRGCEISVLTTKSKNPQLSLNIDYNLSLTGSAQALMEARGDLLRNCPLEIKLTLQIPPTSKLSIMYDHFEKLETELKATIKILPEKANHSSLVSDNTVTIEIVGNPIQVEQCRVRVLVLLDEMKSFKTEIVRLPLKLQYLICGRKRAGLLPIIEETSTNIYFPSPFADTNNNKKINGDDEENSQQQTGDETQPAIYITGELNHVTRVKDMLNKLAVQKAKSMYHKDTALYARKMDWLLLHRRDELRKIMHDNGAYIEFPPIGSGDNRVTVYAENRVNAERTLRALNFQACNIYEACFYFNNHDGVIYDSAGSHTFFDSTSNISSLVSQLSQVSGSEVIYKTDPGCIEVLGAERAIRNVYQRLQEMQFLQVFHQYTIFRVESSNEQRDFISGKKNGKINKIMKTSGAKIRFMPFNDYNFINEVESTSFTKALDGLTLLQEELPAEISFYVPESYHKRIIGVGGKNIQRIMKKYGVYVKFSNTEEFASLGGYYNNEDNVVARTPMKNQINLDNLRHAVMELIHPKDRDYIIETIRIPFGFHRDMIHEYQDNFIAEELTKKTNTHVLWPDAELANSIVELLGPGAHMSLAFKMMESIIPEAYDLHLPLSTKLTAAVQSDSFQGQVVKYLHQGHDIVVEALSFSEEANGDEDGLIRLSMTKDKVSTNLRNALDVVIQYLITKDVKLYDDTTCDTLFEKVNKTQSLSMGNSSRHLLDAASMLKQQAQSIIGSQPSIAMIRSSNGAIYTTTSSSSSNINNSNNNPSPPQAYQFFNFHNNDTTNIQHLNNPNLDLNTTTNNPNVNNSPLDNNNPLDNGGWTPLHMQHHQQGPIPSVSTSVQSNGGSNNGDNNIRAIFDTPMDLTDQERVVLSNYRYQKMSMPPNTNFGFPQAVPTAPTGDIWSTPSQIPGGNRRSAGFTTGGSMTSPPSKNARRSTGNNYSSSAQNDNMQIRMFNEGGNASFYPGILQPGSEFNPYNNTNTPSLKPSQSMPESMLESHFNSVRPPFQTSPNSFHHNQQQTQFNQLNLGNFSRQSNPGGGFDSPPEHNQQPHQFYPNNNEINVVHSMLDFSTVSGSSGYDPRRQPPSDQDKGSRPPPGINI